MEGESAKRGEVEGMKVDQGRTGAARSLSALFFSFTSVMNALLLHWSSVTWLTEDLSSD